MLAHKIHLSEAEFRTIFSHAEMALPIEWDGKDFAKTLKVHLNKYNMQIKTVLGERDEEALSDIQHISYSIVGAVEEYLNGFPSGAYHIIEYMMKTLEDTFTVFSKSSVNIEGYHDPLELYRVTKLKENDELTRKRLFHVPFNLRSKVKTCRYSIAGYPSMYLGTSLELCCKELRVDWENEKDRVVASRFKLNRDLRNSNVNIKVIDLATRPQDFFVDHGVAHHNYSDYLCGNADDRGIYLYWYPVIAACSYIKKYPDDSFAPEYIVPQLLMQWVRTRTESIGSQYKQLIGIRYFSCESKGAAEMGYNYVFPTSGKCMADGSPYCKVLSRSFSLTEPIILHNDINMKICEDQLNNKILQHI